MQEGILSRRRLMQTLGLTAAALAAGCSSPTGLIGEDKSVGNAMTTAPTSTVGGLGAKDATATAAPQAAPAAKQVSQTNQVLVVDGNGEVTGAKAPLSAGSTRGTVVITVDDPQGRWGGPAAYKHTAAGYGIGGSMTWTYVNGSQVSNWIEMWSGQGGGVWEVQVYIPRAYGSTRSARYRVFDGSTGNVKAVPVVNQYAVSDAWVSLGQYSFTNQPGVWLGDDTGEAYATKRMVGFDAVRFIRTTVDPPPVTNWLSVPAYYQTDGRWANLVMRPSNCTLRNYGCLTDAEAAVASAGGFATDPGAFCNYLSANGGYDKNGYLQSDGFLGSHTGGKVTITRTANWTNCTADLNAIKAEIDAGRPVVVNFGYPKTQTATQHFVVATGYVLQSGQVVDLRIMDPLGKASLVSGYIDSGTYSLGRWILGAKFFSRN